MGGDEEGRRQVGPPGMIAITVRPPLARAHLCRHLLACHLRRRLRAIDPLLLATEMPCA